MVELEHKELENKGGQMQVHDACIVRTVDGEKAHLGTKRRQTVKKSSP